MGTDKTNLQQCIERISSETTDYKYADQAINQAESLKSLSSDLYTDNIRFIYELIQNADDAGTKNGTLTILENKYLIIAHNGLGFKAVFGKSNKVIIYSDGEYFRFDSSHQIKWNQQWGTEDQHTWEEKHDRQFIYPWQINPVWTHPDDVPNDIKTFLNSEKESIRVAYIILLNDVEEIRLAIDQLKQQLYMFLFLRNISEMTFVTQLKTDTISISPDSSLGLKKVYINQQIVSQWLIKCFELDVPNDVREKLNNDSNAPEKLRFIEKAEVFFAAKYKDRDGDVIHAGTIEKLRDQESVLFSYLPTKISEYKFPVLINASFLTNANREQIHTDSPWNQWLFDRIGTEIFQWIRELVIDDKFRFQAYQLIPSKLNLPNNIIARRYNESYEMSVKHCNFILNKKNRLLKINEVIMDLTSLSEQTSFIHYDSMRKYIIDYYKNSSFQCDDYPFIEYDSNLQRINVRQFTWQHCIEMFQSDIFLKTHSIERNKQMIKYFYSKYSNIETDHGIRMSVDEIPFLMDRNNRLQSIKNIYFPDKTTDISKTTDSFINKKIFRWLNESTQTEIKQWLQKSGITERSDLTDLHKTIIPNVSTYITLQNAIGKIKMLFVLFQKNSIGKKELDQLKQLKLLTIRQTLIPAEQCFFSDRYKPRLLLEEHLKEKVDKFLSFDYVSNDNQELPEWRRFFTMLGVQEEIHTIIFSQKLTLSEAIEHGFCKDYLCKVFREYHKATTLSDLVTITFLEHTKDNYEFSNLFWSYVLKNIKKEELEQNARIYWGRLDQPGAIKGTLTNSSNYIQWFIRNERIKCIPSTFNTCELASNIMIDTKEMKDLCGEYFPFPSFTFTQDKLNWYRIFNFKTKLLINDCLNLLKKIQRDEKNLENNLDRLQMIYFYILKQIESFSDCEKNIIKSQEDTIYLLCENNQWKLAKNLYSYVEFNGKNNHLNDAIPCLKLNEDNSKHHCLQKFFELFNIKQIREKDLKLDDKDSSPADEFRKKLIEISPFIKNWLKKLAFSSNIISLVDEILQNNISFIESNSLKLSYKEMYVGETDLYFDTRHRKLYVTRPWTSETTLMNLPNKLCQLLNIKGFEDKLRFLLKAQQEEIIKHFTKSSIPIPTDKDIVSLQLLPRSEIVEESKSPSVLPVASSESVCLKEKETKIEKNITVLQDLQRPARSPENRTNNTGLPAAIQSDCNGPLLPCNHTCYNSNLPIQPLDPMQYFSYSPITVNDEDLENIQVVDITSITASRLESIMQRPSIDSEENDGSDLHTGRLGEQIVYEYLKREYSSKASVQWENCEEESKLFYDILLKSSGKTYYIEVKTTRENNQHSFHLSFNQIKAILEHKKYYHIYRVYLKQGQLIILDNIAERLKRNQLSFYLTIMNSHCIDTIQ